VLVAIRGPDPFFNNRRLDIRIGEDGRFIVIPGDRITYLLNNNYTEQCTDVIEELMMHMPVK
jgi:hypothetical protein